MILGAQRLFPELLENRQKLSQLVEKLDSKKLIFNEKEALNAFLIGPIVFPPGFMLGLSGFNESLTLTVGFSEVPNMQPIVRNLFELMKDEFLSIDIKINDMWSK